MNKNFDYTSVVISNFLGPYRAISYVYGQWSDVDGFKSN